MEQKMALSGADYTVMFVIGCIVLGLGWYFRHSQSSSKDFLLAGRSAPWIAVGISQLATLLSAISYLGNPGEAYNFDLQFLVYIILGYASVPIVIRCFLDFFYRLELTSIHGYLERRFDLRTRVFASCLFILARLAWMATVLIAVAVAIEQLIGLSEQTSILVVSILALAYTLLGGMRAIIWTDVLQFFLFLFGMIGAIWVLVHQDSWQRLYEIAQADQKLTLVNFSVRPTDRINIWICIFAGGIAGMANLTDQVSMQRYLSTRTLADARRAIWIKPFLSIPVLVMTFVLGLCLYGHYQIHPMPPEVSVSGDKVFPYFIRTEMSGGLAGLMITAILAAAMSSIDSGIHTISTVCLEDYIVRFRKQSLSAEQHLRMARHLTIFWAVVIALVALWLVDEGSIIGVMYRIIAPYFGCLTAVFLLGTVFTRANGFGAFWGSVLAYGTVLFLQRQVIYTTGGWSVRWLESAESISGASTISNFAMPFVGFTLTLVAGNLLSRFRAQPRIENLEGLCLKHACIDPKRFG
ncbi:MAG: sodium/solute symporter [Planctomycetota bacterium]